MEEVWFGGLDGGGGLGGGLVGGDLKVVETSRRDNTVSSMGTK